MKWNICDLSAALAFFSFGVLAACQGASVPRSPQDFVVPVSESVTSTSPGPATPTPTAKPEPTGEMPLITMEEYGFQLRYPAEYQASIFRNGICLTLERGYSPPGLCHIKNFSIEVYEAEGRSLGEVADEAAAIGNSDVEVRRTRLMVSGEEAVLLDGIGGVDRLRIVVIVQGDRAYVLTFVGWQENQQEISPLGVLYDTVINSFTLLRQHDVASDDKNAWRISAVSPVTIYSGPGGEYPSAGILEAGANTRVLESIDGGWMNIVCPASISGSCWVLWDMNAIHSYEGPPVALNIPEPSSLEIEFANRTLSPDGRWQVLVTQSENVALDGEFALFFYVELIVSSLEDGTTWTPVSEWHVYGLGHEYAPIPFQWSQDGRYLYYTSLFDLHGACAYFYNISDYLNRLDLSDGSVAVLSPPYPHGILAISPDETMMAYLGDQGLVVRELAASYAAVVAGQASVTWQVPLDTVWPTQVSQIAWSPDNRRVIVTVSHWVEGLCEIAGHSTWELDVETGAFMATSTFIPTPTPTPIPPTPCPVPAATGGIGRETFLIFCGREDQVNIIHNDSLIIDDGLTVEAYVSYLGGGGVGPRVIEIIDTFNLSYAENKVWFCLFSQEFVTNQGNGWHCLTYPQPVLNQWVHLAGSWDGENMYLFIDGQLKAETGFPGPLFHGGPGDQSLKIGNGWTLIDGFHGFIDEVRLSSIGRYRSDFEPQGRFAPDIFTVGLWHFDEGQGTAAADESSHENHGFLSPFLRWGSAH